MIRRDQETDDYRSVLQAHRKLGFLQALHHARVKERAEVPGSQARQACQKTTNDLIVGGRRLGVSIEAFGHASRADNSLQGRVTELFGLIEASVAREQDT